MDNGSLAIWYEWRPAQKGHATRAEIQIHINLWRRRFKRRSNEEETFLDIGLRIRDPSSIGSFNLYFPLPLRQSDVVDLGGVLHDRRTLMAVFNEAFTVDDKDQFGTFGIRESSDQIVLRCHSLAPGADFTVATRQYDSQFATIIHFTDRLCSRFGADEDQYIRFRVVLDKQSDKAFSQLKRQTDWLFVSAIPRDEVVEFRFNERRSLPQEIVNEMSQRDHYELFKVVVIHYFLIRESDSQFVMAQADFHKVRLLENSLWSRYLMGTKGGALQHEAFIYHWRRIAPPNTDLPDFHALSKFRRMVIGWTIGLYVLVILIVGIVGNLAAAYIWDRLHPPVATSTARPVATPNLQPLQPSP